ncbi:MAG: efflux transporter outer membrane subunit [Gammaproteobacteria bacterium]|nr:efflux transporter outer membrane subunit [Gammaproteobacteria bacterium]
MIFVSPVLLTGCLVGPNFQPPPSPATHRYTDERLPEHTVATPSLGKAGIVQHFKPGRDIPHEWWGLFQSKSLDQLVRLSLKNSPNLAAAKAALAQARENLLSQIGTTLFPSVDLQGFGQRQRFSDDTIGFNQGSIFNLFNVQANVSYTLDLFGGARRAVEAYGAQVDYQQYQLIGAYLALTANVVTTAITVASFKAQIAATLDLLRAQEVTLNILTKQFDLGGISRTQVYTQETLVNQTRASLPSLQKRLAQSKHALAALVGVLPSCKLPELELSELTLPANLPVVLPSRLVRMRPDIQASEALLHAASAQIGVATANLLPQVTLSGYYGWTAMTASGLFDPANHVWSVMSSFLQPVFRGGALQAQRRAAIDACQQAFQQYRQTVLQAFQNVADSLQAIETDGRILKAQRTAEIAARNSLTLAQSQYRLGGASYIVLLNAQQQYQQTRITRIQAQTNRYNDTAGLLQALGGGWWNYPRTACQSQRCIVKRTNVKTRGGAYG